MAQHAQAVTPASSGGCAGSRWWSACRPALHDGNLMQLYLLQGAQLAGPAIAHDAEVEGHPAQVATLASSRRSRPVVVSGRFRAYSSSRSVSRSSSEPVDAAQERGWRRGRPAPARRCPGCQRTGEGTRCDLLAEVGNGGGELKGRPARQAAAPPVLPLRANRCSIAPVIGQAPVATTKASSWRTATSTVAIARTSTPPRR